MTIREAEDDPIPATQPVQHEEAMENPDAVSQPTQEADDKAEE